MKPKHNILDQLVPLMVPIDSVKLDPRNARRHPEENLDTISLSIETFQQVKPIVVLESTKVILAGNGMWTAAKRMGWTHIAAVFVKYDPTTAIGFAIADNRSSDLSSFDNHILAELIVEADVGLFPTEAMGFTREELEKLVPEDPNKVTGKPKPEMEWSKELLHEENYVVLQFTDTPTWLAACEKLKIKQVKLLRRPSSKEGFPKVGIGRVIDGSKVIERLRD